jgi:hypothetical protein
MLRKICPLVDCAPTYLLFLHESDAQNLMQVCKLIHDAYRTWYLRRRTWRSDALFLTPDSWKHVRKLRLVQFDNSETLVLDELLVRNDDYPIDASRFSARHFTIADGVIAYRTFYRWPDKCTSLEISAEVGILNLPDGMIQLTNHYPFAHILSNLPTSIEKLCTGELCEVRHLSNLAFLELRTFAWSLHAGSLGTCLHTLHLWSFNQVLEPHVLPSSITSLQMDNYTRPLVIGSLPVGLVTLQMDNYTRPLVIGSLPVGLITLRMHMFQEPLAHGVIPRGLKVLEVPFYQRILYLPNTLEHLYVHDVFEPTVLPQSLLSLKVRNVCAITLPDSITSLTLRAFPKFPLPPKLTNLYFRNDFQKLHLDKCPGSLRSFHMWSSKTPTPIDCQIGYWMQTKNVKWTLYLAQNWKHSLERK